MYNNPSSEIVSASIDDLQSKPYQKRKIPAKLLKLMEMDNIATTLDEQELTDISSLVVSTYEEDAATREKWDEMMEKAYALIDTALEIKNTPWPGAANIKYPMIMEACIQFNARIGPEIIKDDTVVNVRVMGEDNVIPPPPMPGGGPQQGMPGQGMPQQPMGGGQPPMGGPQQAQQAPPDEKESDRAQRLSDHMSYQLLAQSTHWESDTDKLLMVLSMTGVVYRKSFFNTITGHPDTEFCLPTEIVVNNNISSLENALRITQRQKMSSNQLIEAMRSGMFIEYPIEDLREQPAEEEELKNTANETHNNLNTNDEEDTIHALLEQHRYLDLDGDGYKEPYIVTLHEGSRKVLRIVARYDEKGIEFNEDGKFIRINPIHYFTDFHFIPNPDGSFHSIGFGMLLMQLNTTVNSILNQLIDAGTLSNRQSGFVNAGLRLPSGDYSFRPGEWVKVKVPFGSDIGSNIFPLPTKEPSQALLALMNFLIETGQTLTSISDVMQGETPPPNTPAATTAAMVEQGQKIFSAILKRIHNSLKKEFTKLYEINKKYMAESETFPLAVGSKMVTVEDYTAVNFGIYPVANPELSSNVQRVAQARALLELIGNPSVNPVPILKNYLEVLRVQNIDEILIENPPPNPAAILELKGKAAEVKLAELEPAFRMMDKEHKTIELELKESEQKAKTAYYGVQAAEKKINSAVLLAESESELGQQAVTQGVEETEEISKGTQMEDIPIDEYQKLSELESGTTQTLEQLQQQIAPQPQPGQGQMQPPPAGEQQPEPGQ